MSGVILTVLDHPTAAVSLLAAARRLAELTGAGRINALLVRAPPEAGIAAGEEILTEWREAELRAAETSRADAVRAIFDSWLPDTEHAGFTAEWIDVDGIAELIVEERGRRADFLGRAAGAARLRHELACIARSTVRDRPAGARRPCRTLGRIRAPRRTRMAR